MINRRDLLIGGGCLAAAGGAWAMTPRKHMSLAGKLKIEDEIPDSFAGWTRRDNSNLIVPQSEDSLSAKLYSQIVGRLFARDDGRYVMMLIAYGDTQNDLLQLHRPEVCYPAFGFQVSDSHKQMISVAPGVAIPGRSLIARAPARTEYISYWTRIGEYLPVDGREQRMMKLRTQFAGIVPDGVLVRLSTDLPDATEAFALNQSFAADLLTNLPARVIPALVGTQISTELARSVSSR